MESRSFPFSNDEARRFAKHLKHYTLRGTGMASVAGHELNHVADYVSGAYAGWANKYNDTKIANWYSERNAYGWEIRIDSPFKNQAKYDEYNNLINGLK